MKIIITFITLTLLLTSLTFGESSSGTSARSKVKVVGVQKMEASKIVAAKKSVRKVAVSKMFNSINRKVKFAKIPIRCKRTYDTDVRGAKAQLKKCLDGISAKWDTLSNSQLMQICGNKTMQQCYDDFVNAEKVKCSVPFLKKISELTIRYIQCVEKGIHKKN